MPSRGIRSLLTLFAVATALAFVVTDADARIRGGFGSRGARTFSAPPPTATAPRPARPMERTLTQPGQPGSTINRPATAGAGGFFNRPGLLGGLAAGFLGAGLFGLLFGHGFLGGLGSLASMLGFLLQIVLVVIVARLIWSWWQRRNQPAFASGPALRDIDPRSQAVQSPLGGAGASGQRASGLGAPQVAPADFDVFERLLGEIQTAFGKEDLAALRTRATPEILSYMSDELAQNASRGLVNRISNVKLLQGDLAEAWSEGDTEYATVAMRYSLVDEMVESASGRVVEGGPDEATEMWTFRRARSGNWILSAIQQTD